MKLEKDKIVHLKGGALLVPFFAITLFIAFTLGAGFALAFGCAGVSGGLELYQKHRNEGTPSFWDAVASAVPGVVVGLGYELWKFLA